MSDGEHHTFMDGKLHVYRRENSRFWQCSTYLDGCNHRRSTGEENLALACEFARDWYMDRYTEHRVRSRGGEIVAAEEARLRKVRLPGPRGRSRTFKEAADGFLDEYKVLTFGERNACYVDGKTRHVNARLKPFFGNPPLYRMTAGRIQAYRVSRMTPPEGDAAKDWRPPAKSTLHHELVTLRQILKWANRQGWIHALPDMSAPYRQSGKVAHRAWFSPEEYKQLYEATRERARVPKKERWRPQCEKLHDYVLFMANTGLRPDEASRLQFRDVRVITDPSSEERILEIEVRGKRGVVKPVGQALAEQYGRDLNQKPESDWLPIVRKTAIDMMMEMIRGDLAALNVKHDVFFSERSLIQGEDRVGAIIAQLQKDGEVYEGRLPPPKGAPVEDYEDREQTLFRSTDFGDDVDRPLKKSDGSYTYFASDIAYHKSKFDRGFRDMIDVWGADHGGYIKRMRAAVKAISKGEAALDVKIVQLVRLLRAGEPVKMSKRSGEFVTLREVVDEVGSDAVRFMMLYRKNDATLDFDLAKVIEQSRENPVFYVQYAHARCHSVFRQAREIFPNLPETEEGRVALLASAPLDRLTDPGELSIIRRVALYPRLIETAALAHEPHRIAFYLYELASEFHAHFTQGKGLPHLRFIRQDDEELTVTRLALVQAVVTVFASGLGLLGVGAPEEMR